MIRKITHRPFFIRLFNWEYWPFHVVYGPLYLYWLWLCLRARSFFFFNTANPSVKNGGFLMESKWAIYNLMDPAYYPSTLYFEKGTDATEILESIHRNAFQFPLIGKPDIGMQGLAVKKILDEKDLIDYVTSSKVNFLIQEFVAYEQEVGIFYYRYPGAAKGHISGIVGKEFLTVTGDGVSTIETLLRKNKRYILQLPELRKNAPGRLEEVPAKGKEEVLVPYGNHVRGAKFLDVSEWADEQFTASIDKVCRQIEGFYYGRLDIRYRSLEELKQGVHFSIIELNGAGSEPTHMYDPKHSLFFAWKEIIRHWNILWKISRANHRLHKTPYMKTSEGLRMLQDNREYVKLIGKGVNRSKVA